MTKTKANDELVFLPLGGSDEVGMNLNAYGYGPEANREWLIVDVGGLVRLRQQLPQAA